jgi:hypothetical protein
VVLDVKDSRDVLVGPDDYCRALHTVMLPIKKRMQSEGTGGSMTAGTWRSGSALTIMAMAGSLKQAVSVIHVLVPVLGFSILGIVLAAYITRLVYARLQDNGYRPIPTVSRRLGASVLPTGSLNTADDAENEAITPVVTKVSSPRCSLILSLFSFVALCFFVDGAILVIYALKYKIWVNEDWVYAVGGCALFGSVAVVMAWQRAKVGEWGKWYPRLVTWLDLLAEAAQAGVWTAQLRQGKTLPCSRAVDRVEHGSLAEHGGRLPVLPALRITLLAMRIATLLFLALLQTHLLYRTSFVPASTVSPQTSYGTFANGKQSPSPITSQPEKKKAPPPPSFKIFIERIKILSPYLWPSKHLGLQLVAGLFHSPLSLALTFV